MNYCLTLCEIHMELKDLNLKVAMLAANIKNNSEELGV